MSQQTLTVHTVTVKPFQENMFEEFLAIDGDFNENEDYFREDTISLGFRNEAHRLSKEWNEKFTKEWQSHEDTDDEFFESFIDKYLEELAHVQVGRDDFQSQFILGNQTYTSDYVITTVSDFIDYDAEITVVVSFMG